MPFRVRWTGKVSEGEDQCFGYYQHQNENLSISSPMPPAFSIELQSCTDTTTFTVQLNGNRTKTITSFYSPMQLFHFIPRLISTQPIQFISLIDERVYCLISQADGSLSATSCSNPRDYNAKKEFDLNQLYMIKILPIEVGTPIPDYSKEETGVDSDAECRNSDVFSVSIAQVTDMNDVGVLNRWFTLGGSNTGSDGSNSKNATLHSNSLKCVTIIHDYDSGSSTAATKNDTRIMMRPCHSQNVDQIFFAQRSTTNAWRMVNSLDMRLSNSS